MIACFVEVLSILCPLAGLIFFLSERKSFYTDDKSHYAKCSSL